MSLSIQKTNYAAANNKRQQAAINNKFKNAQQNSKPSFQGWGFLVPNEVTGKVSNEAVNALFKLPFRTWHAGVDLPKSLRFSCAPEHNTKFLKKLEELRQKFGQDYIFSSLENMLPKDLHKNIKE